ncbi:MAG: VOC family protein [Candidatus Schekmanbacteria bacterium]|nr:VOC family protein [Candidatus Schekmanbacteria bacterium]
MINALQHIAIGVTNLDHSYRFYRDVLGFRVKLADAAVRLPEVVLSRPRPPHPVHLEARVVFAFHPQGGAGLELVQLLSTPPRMPPEAISWRDLGIVELGIEVADLPRFHRSLTAHECAGMSAISQETGPDGVSYAVAYLRDPDGLLIQLVDRRHAGSAGTRGIHHLGIAVADLSRARRFYAECLGFDRPSCCGPVTLRDPEAASGAFLEAEVLWLERSQPSRSNISSFDRGMIKLASVANHRGVHAFLGRRWGDIGLHEVALDVANVQQTLEDLAMRGVATYWQASPLRLGPGSAASFGHVQDPETNTIELVAIHRLLGLAARLPGSLFFGIVRRLSRVWPREIDVSRLLASRIELD